MNYDRIVEYFAQKVDESRREEFREKASKIKDASDAEALGKEFGIVPTEEDRKALFEIAGSMELSDEMLSRAAGGDKDYDDWDWEDHLKNCISWGTYRP